MCITLYFNFCTHYSMLTTKSLVSTHHHRVDPHFLLPTISSPLRQSLLCSLYLSFWFCLVRFVHLLLLFYSPHMSEIIWYLSFSVISFGIVPSRSIHVVSNDKILYFLWLSNIPLCINTTSSLSIHLLMGT